jgi:hypothetical protein
MRAAASLWTGVDRRRHNAKKHEQLKPLKTQLGVMLRTWAGLPALTFTRQTS